ncbi:MAG: hypothetical protein ACI9FN_002239 [Saprospiraceae bacterium]|jgi:hypothetical protein
MDTNGESEESEWKLYGFEGGHRYELNPREDDKIINLDDRATVELDATDTNAITFVLFGRVNFKKI